MGYPLTLSITSHHPKNKKISLTNGIQTECYQWLSSHGTDQLRRDLSAFVSSNQVDDLNLKTIPIGTRQIVQYLVTG